ncbi:hypothetical protein Tco_1423084 [Tanacetum coccineum]
MGRVKVINMISFGGSQKRPHEGTEPRVTTEIAFPLVPQNCLTDSLIVLEAMIEGFKVRIIYVDRGNSLEFMYEYCFKGLSARTRSRLRTSNVLLVGLLGEVSFPLQCDPKKDLNEKPQSGRFDHSLNDQVSNGHRAGNHQQVVNRMQQKLVEVLCRNTDAFAWTPSVQYTGWIANAISIQQRDGTPTHRPQQGSQIWISEEDEEKTTFCTDRGVFCYTQMLKGLKNFGATYQRLMDRENMSFKMERRENGRILDEKCTKLMLHKKSTTDVRSS